MSQYEPIVLKKKQLRTVAGTPAGLIYNFIKSTLLVIPVAGMVLLSNYITEKKKLIAELDEYDLYNKKMTKLEEYEATKNAWKNPHLQPIVETVLKRYKETGQLTTIDENSVSRAEMRAENQ